MPTPLPLIQSDALAACCSPMTAGIVDDETAESSARMFKAISDPARAKLLSLIAAADRQEACVCDLTGFLGLAQSTVSHHMKILVEAGLVARERRGKWAYYSMAPGSLDALASTLAPMA